MSSLMCGGGTGRSHGPGRAYAGGAGLPGGRGPSALSPREHGDGKIREDPGQSESRTAGGARGMDGSTGEHVAPAVRSPGRQEKLSSAPASSDGGTPSGSAHGRKVTADGDKEPFRSPTARERDDRSSSASRPLREREVFPLREERTVSTAESQETRGHPQLERLRDPAPCRNEETTR